MTFDIDQAAKVIDTAHGELGEVCVKGPHNRFRMSVPVRPDRDTDVIIGAGLSAGEEALAALRRVLELAEQWRYKGEFGWDNGSHAEGPDQEGYVLDQASTELRAAVAGPTDDGAGS